LGVAGDRPGLAEDLLWQLASNVKFLALQGVARDAIMFLTSAYPLESLKHRTDFEMSALSKGLFPEGREARWWRSVLARLLSSIPPDQLATLEMQALRAEFDAAGDLTGNPPFMSMTSSW